MSKLTHTHTLAWDSNETPTVEEVREFMRGVPASTQVAPGALSMTVEWEVEI